MRLTATVALGVILVGGSLAVSAQPAAHGPAAPGAGSYQDPYASYGPEFGGPGPDAVTPSGCHQEWCHPYCGCWKCRLRHGLPDPCVSRCDMPQHLAYIAEPKFYYYFRPYNWFHIPVQQDDVRAFGGDPRDPYDNRMFQNVYQNLHFEEPAPEDVVPPEATPMGAKKPSLRARQVATDNTASRATAPTKPAATKEISSVRIRPVK